MTQLATLTIATVDYTVYGLTSNVLQDANNYHAANLAATAWTSATDDQKKSALVTAFRAIEREKWSGTADSSATQWPRTGATQSGEALADSVIPDNIVLGQFEFALAALADPSILTNTSTASGIKKVEAGSAKVTYHYPLTGASRRWPLPVNDLLLPFLTSTGSATTLLPYVGGGTANDSDLGTLDTDLNHGLA